MLRHSFSVASCAAIICALSAAALAETAQQCAPDRAKTQAVFSERFPHERCDLTTTCDPKLVQTAATLALERCRRAAIDNCGQDTVCTSALTDQWSSSAGQLKADTAARWADTDQTQIPKLVARRFNHPEAFTLNTNCADHASCSAQALQNLTRMERLDSYLNNQEARQ